MAKVGEKKVAALYEKYLILTEENKKKILDMSRFLVLTQDTVVPSIRDKEPGKSTSGK
jgi:hypothetical protein